MTLNKKYLHQMVARGQKPMIGLTPSGRNQRGREWTSLNSSLQVGNKHPFQSGTVVKAAAYRRGFGILVDW